jgi:hypothetical protein
MKKLTMQGFSHMIVPVVAVLAVGLIGNFMLVESHAASSCGPSGAWKSSAKNGARTDGGYFFDNNEWGAVSGSSQTIWEKSASSWGICSRQPNPPAGIKTYAEEQKTVNKPISSFKSMTNTVSYSVPSKGTWEVADDLWINGTVDKAGAIEVMIWTYNHYQTPAGTKVGAVTIGSQKYTFYKKTGSKPIYTLAYQKNTTSTTVHMLSALNWLAARGYIKPSMNFSQFNFGYEVVGTHGITENFTTKSFSLNLN